MPHPRLQAGAGDRGHRGSPGLGLGPCTGVTVTAGGGEGARCFCPPGSRCLWLSFVPGMKHAVLLQKGGGDRTDSRDLRTHGHPGAPRPAPRPLHSGVTIASSRSPSSPGGGDGRHGEPPFSDEHTESERSGHLPEVTQPAGDPAGTESVAFSWRPFCHFSARSHSSHRQHPALRR